MSTGTVMKFQTGRFVQTRDAAAMLHLLEDCQNHGRMGVICGVPGVGKTRTINEYKEQNKYAWISTLSRVTSNLCQGLMHISETLGEAMNNNVRSSAYAARSNIEYAITYALGSHRTGLSVVRANSGLLIIDEAQNADDQLLEELRHIHDQLGIGIVFCGNHKFPTRFTGKDKTGSFIHFEQFTSRVDAWIELGSTDPDDVRAICQDLGVSQPKAIQFLIGRAQAGGNLRTVVDTINRAKRRTGGGPVGVDDLKHAALIRTGKGF